MIEKIEYDGAESMHFDVILSPTAEQVLKNIKSKEDLRRIDGILSVLDTVPYIGRSYDPLYDAARLDGSVLVAYAGHFGIYYEVVDAESVVFVYFIEDQRRDPMRRFGSDVC